LIQQLDIETLVIKLDKDGSYLQVAGGPGRHIPTRVRQVYDVTGAGDQVIATMAVARAAGVDWQQAVELANIAAGIEVSRFGVCSVTIEQIIQDILTNQSQPSSSSLVERKVLPLDQLLKELGWRRRIGYKVVFTNGCFDLLHRGHIEYLAFCKRQGHVLVVGLNSDSSVRLIKGPDRPINSQQDRAALLAALEAVDFVTIFDQPTPLALIETIRPDVLVKGRDWEKKGVVGAELITSYGGKVVLAPIVEGKSTTATIEQIRALADPTVVQT
jgi:D-beta-D-heptose 7-phosphate kinase/D-beta-D-heptose 1-phosphate adenosyltransferase